MARIRSIKPEHTFNEKIGGLSDRAYRLWIALLCNADDEGRGTAKPNELRVKVYAYQAAIKTEQIAAVLRELATANLLLLYSVEGKTFYQLHDWHEHQKIQHPSPSKFPSPTDNSAILMRPHENSGVLTPDLTHPNQDQGSNQGPNLVAAGNGSNGKIGHRSSLSLIPDIGPFPSAQAFVDLYNQLTPDECPGVKTLSAERKKKITQYLTAFPDEAFWREVFTQAGQSRFLRGLCPRPGHEHFRAKFDWFLQVGQDGTENCVKVYEGYYRDKAA